MADKICTLSYAYNNFNNFKVVGQSIPNTLKGITKSEVLTYLAIEPNSLDSYASNRLVPINKIKPVSIITTKIGFNNNVNSIIRQNNTLVAIVGNFTNYNNNTTKYFTSVGLNGVTQYASTNYGVGTDGGIYTVRSLDNGYFFLGGVFNNYKGTNSKCLVLLKDDSTLFKTYQLTWSVGLAVVITSAKMPDGGVLFGGSFRTMDGIDIGCIVKILSTGLKDTSFTYNVINSNVNAIRILNNKIYIASDGGVKVLNINGTIDTSFIFGTNTNGNVYDIFPFSDGSMLIVGVFTTYKGISANRIVKILSNGDIDLSFNYGTGLNFPGESIEFVGDQIFLVGSFTTYNGVSCNSMIRLNMDGSLDTSFNSGTGFATYSGTSLIMSSLLYVPEINAIYVGGSFSYYNGIISDKIVILNLDGTTFQRYNLNTN